MRRSPVSVNLNVIPQIFQIVELRRSHLAKVTVEEDRTRHSQKKKATENWNSDCVTVNITSCRLLTLERLILIPDFRLEDAVTNTFLNPRWKLQWIETVLPSTLPLVYLLTLRRSIFILECLLPQLDQMKDNLLQCFWSPEQIGKVGRRALYCSALSFFCSLKYSTDSHFTQKQINQTEESLVLRPIMVFAEGSLKHL